MITPIINPFLRALCKNNFAISSYNIYRPITPIGVEHKVSVNDKLVHALVRFSLLNTSLLVVEDNNCDIIGVYTRDMYLRNIARLDGRSDSVFIGELYRPKEHESVAYTDTTLIDCYDKIMRHNINDLLVLDKNNSKKFGVIGSNDIIHTILKSIR